MTKAPSNEPLWTPSPQRAAATAMHAFRKAAERHAGRDLPDSGALHAWSVRDPEAFWSFYAEWAELPFRGDRTSVLRGAMPDVHWFEGTTFNYAQALLYPPGTPDGRLAVHAIDEAGFERRLTFAELRTEVDVCARGLVRAGVGPGDRVAAYIANVPEAVILLLACAQVGAVFSSCSPDFGFEAAYARFSQIEPKVLVATDGYAYNGRTFPTRDVARRLEREIGSVQMLVLVPGTDERGADATYWGDWLTEPAGSPEFAALPFDHPLYVLYSSGTTGLPKAMVHRAGGAYLMHHKEHRLHCDIRPGDVVLYFTTCGWMMWNWLVSALGQGATIVLYEGSPGHPTMDTLWKVVERFGVTFFGTSARFLHASRDAGVVPRASRDLARLRTIASTGSPLSPGGFTWVYDAVKPDVHLASISGGTDIVGCFMLGDPTRPVFAGQIQGPGLGVDLAAFDDDARPVVGQPGELVCRQPLPSMPLAFWNDPEGERYRDAYFAEYPGVWRHGDLIEITPEGGVIVYGRSDATLNPGGVRIGTAEIYRPLEAIPEVREACAVGKRTDDDEEIWLFVVLSDDVRLDEDLTQRIRTAIREGSSPRHVPRRVVAVPDLPRTRSGKSMEMAVARLVNGRDVPNREVMMNPDACARILEALEPAS